jgi:hypothetical protein
MSRERDKPPASALLRGAPLTTASARRLGMPDAEHRAESPPSGADFGDVALSGAEPLQDGGAPAAGGCAEQITWVPVSPVPTDIRADSAVEFAAGVDAALGAGGHTDVSIEFNPTEDKGRMTSVGMKVTSSIIRPRWAGGRPSQADADLIKRVETFIKEHEERHRDLSRSVMQKAVCDALNQPVAQAKAILKKAICDLEPKAQEALDAKEGQLEWVKNASGAVVDFKAVGTKHDYHVKGCDPFAAPKPGKDAPKEGEK